MIKIVLLTIFFRVPVLVLLCVLIAISIFSMLSPVYKFATPVPFKGDNIYNPYAGFDTILPLKKGNFHAHSKLDNGVTNGSKSIEGVVADYKSYDYDIVGISNYQTISKWNPLGEEYDIPVYEHGYNIMKFHQLVFGHGEESFQDVHLPLSLSGYQYILTHLGKTADAICLNHPRFTLFFPASNMKFLRGYRFIEADAGMSPAFEWWDTGLSSGIPSFILSGDDSHNTSRPHDIASHCVFICSISTKYADVIGTLKEGNFYSMRIPNFGNGDTAVKHFENSRLPRVSDIGFKRDSVYVTLSAVADTIKFIGQHGLVRSFVTATNHGAHYFDPEDTYIRTEVVFTNGVKIYTNPTFRYGQNDPFTDNMPEPFLPLTILINALRGLLIIFFMYLILLVIRPLFR